MGENVGIVLAGGKGERFGTVPPKQFVFIKDKMIIEYTIENLMKSKEIDKIYLTVNPDYIPLGKEIASRYGEIVKIIEGGRTRTESIYNSALALEDNVDKVVFIDAVRPFVLPHVFDEFIHLLEKHEAVAFCSKIVSYLVETDGRPFINRVEDRNKMRLCNAPTGYQASLLREVTSKVPREEILKFESEFEVILTYFPDVKIFTYESSEFNLKITYKEDLQLASILLHHSPRST